MRAKGFCNMLPRALALIAALIIVVQISYASFEASSTDLSLQNPARKPELQSNVPDIKASSAILLESARGQVLYEKQPQRKSHVSFVCKIMTAIVAIEKCKIDAKVTISKESASSEGSVLNLEGGEKYTVEELLYAVLLTSANDAANALAEFAGGDIDKFVDMMNSKARELKMNDTRFKNPSGLYDESQYTTAYDTSLLIRYALNNPIFSRIFSTKARPMTIGSSTKVLVNQNKLFWSYDGVDGGKTGYNDKTHQAAVTTATRNGQKLICIVFDSPEDIIFKDSTQLLNYGFDNFKTGLLVPKGQSLKVIQVEGKDINLISINDVYYTYPIGDNYIKSIEFRIKDNINLPVLKDHILGSVRYLLKDGTVIDIDLYPDREILPPESILSKGIRKLTENKDILFLIVILILVEFLLVLHNIIRLIKNKIFHRES